MELRMASFDFESIPVSQAANYNAAVDSLNFQTAGASGAMVTVSYLAPDQVGVTLGGQTITFGAGLMGGAATFADGSHLFVGGPGGDAATGTALGDGLFGGLGDDTLAGGEGNNLLQGNQGADMLSGGSGNDTIYGGRDNDNIDVGLGVNFGQGNMGNDTVSAALGSGPNTLLGGQGNDVVVGAGDNDFLNGNLGDDSVSGGAGNDVLRGEDGADTLDGGLGADTMNGGAGPDRFIFGPGSSDVTLQGADRIEGWSTEDVIDIPGVAAGLYMIPVSYDYDGGGYGGYGGYGGMGGMGGMGATVMPITFDAALAQANAWFRNYPNWIVTAQVDEGVAVFVDSNGDRVADLSFILVGANISDVTGFAFA
jgi:Ca2+-binding RTX toxin-like protein